MIWMMRIIHISDWHGSYSMLPEADLYISSGDMLANFYANRLHDANEQKKEALATNFSTFLGSPKSPLVCVRGNHDFIDLSSLFVQCNLVHEFIDIFGTWNDEVVRADLKDRMRRMPQADIYLTHYGPTGILSNEGPNDYGLEGMGDWMINLAGGRRGLHCFGHIHGSGGRTVTYDSHSQTRPPRSTSSTSRIQK